MSMVSGADLARREPPLGPWRSHRPAGLPVLRWTLLTVVVLGVVAWLLLTPRQARAVDFVSDLQRGAVRSIDIGQREDFDRFRGLRVNDNPSSYRVLAWCTGPLGCHQVATNELSGFPDDQQGLDGGFPDDAQVVERLVSEHSPDARPTWGQPYPWLAPLAATWPVVWLVLLFVLITGPQPRRATKWATFWLLSIPGGLGMLWALAREAPWSRRVAALPEPPPGPGPGRWTGGWTFLATFFLAGLATELPKLVEAWLP